MEFSNRKIIIESWHKVRENLNFLILIMLFILALNLVISGIQEKILEEITIQAIVFTIASYLFQAGINLGMIKVAINIQNKIEASFSNIFNHFHMLINYILATIILLIILILVGLPGLIVILFSISYESSMIYTLFFPVGLILVIIPAIYASIRMQFYDYFLVDEECGVVESIKKSLMITDGYVGELFLLGATVSIIILISMIPLMIGLLVSIPLSVMVNAYVFNSLKKHFKYE